MARVEDSKPSGSTGSYMRVFGNCTLNQLMQQVQSTSIRNGNQLEQCIEECADRYGCLYSDIDKFLEYFEDTYIKLYKNK